MHQNRVPQNLLLFLHTDLKRSHVCDLASVGLGFHYCLFVHPEISYLSKQQ